MIFKNFKLQEEDTSNQTLDQDEVLTPVEPEEETPSDEEETPDTEEKEE